MTAAAPRPRTVLIVDDQAAFRDAADMVVELAEGYATAGVAATGEEGVVLASELLPDVVLMDVNLPGIDGFEATREILAVSRRSRVLVLSTYSSDEYEGRARDAGAVGFVSKGDFGPADLEAFVWLSG